MSHLGDFSSINLAYSSNWLSSAVLDRCAEFRHRRADCGQFGQNWTFTSCGQTSHISQWTRLGSTEEGFIKKKRRISGHLKSRLKSGPIIFLLHSPGNCRP